MFIFLLLSIYYVVYGSTVRETVDHLSHEVEKLQTKKTVNGTPPFSLHKDAGLYPSHVKLNFHGNWQLAEIRELFEVYDNNMFATAWITNCLLEANMFGVGPKPSSPQVQLSLKAIGQYSDHNRHYNNSIMTFWPQVYNATSLTWESAPKNLLDLFDLTNELPMKALEEFLKLIGLKNIEKVMEILLREKDIFLRAFHIPPDFDDTFINIGLGSLLKESNDSALYNEWAKTNSNVTSAFVALKQYAYRPYSSDRNQNSIDPRTYFYLRDFISNSDESLALVPTWIQNVDEACKSYFKGVAMPFTINNVDVTVSANVVFGITASLLSGLVDKDIFDADLQNIYNHTTLMMSYEMSHNFSNRRDLALTYYPSKFECYWFIARTVTLLRRYKATQPLPFKVMDEALDRFTEAFNGPVFDDIIKSAQTDKLNRIYFDDFLGDADFTITGSPINKAEDRLFTTTMAVNTLIDAFTVFNPTTKKLEWIEMNGVIENVKLHVDLSVTFLEDFILSRSYKTWNAFFSGSGKSKQSMPFPYPANRLEFLNGTKFKPDKFPGAPFIIGIEGVVSEADYAAMLNETHFGEHTPIDFEGFNPASDPEGFFPFWSSDAYTYATTMLAFSKYLNIDDNTT